jgi:uncharacterized protein YlxW (UPF0749 family)
MSEGRPGPSVPDGTGDEAVVPHPFGPGHGADAEESEPAPDDATPDDATPDDTTPDDATPDGAPPEERAPEEPEPATAHEPPQDAGTEPEAPPEVPAPTGRRRVRRDPLAAVLIGVLTLLLGFAIAVQVRSVGDEQVLAGAREEDLVRILDELSARESRLRDQISDQRSALQDLAGSDGRSSKALQAARARAQEIGILNGTVAAEGPGLVLTIRDPGDVVRVADIVDTIQELRGAGAETMQIGGVRVGVDTAVTGSPGDLEVDGRAIAAPYEFVVIGSPQGMETAMNIPGGVVPHITSRGGSVTIVQSERVVVDALRRLDTPQYASPETDD